MRGSSEEFYLIVQFFVVVVLLAFFCCFICFSEYGIYSTRFKTGSSGTTVCHIRKRGHQVDKIRRIGTSNAVFIVYSPGITLEPPQRWEREQGERGGVMERGRERGVEQGSKERERGGVMERGRERGVEQGEKEQGERERGSNGERERERGGAREREGWSKGARREGAREREREQGREGRSEIRRRRICIDMFYISSL